jgi:very-short-patch-repair endonuclease
VIEVDGGQHASARAYDEARTRFIEGEGYRLLRFWNNEVLGNTEGVVRTIASAIAAEGLGK